MDCKKERVTRQTENYLYDWIDRAKRERAETHLPADLVTELRATSTVGEWHRIVSRVSDEIWRDASPAEMDRAIQACENQLAKAAGLPPRDMSLPSDGGAK